MTERRIDIESLNPVERMELADALYDSAMQEIEAAPLTPDQLAELDRRIAQIESGEAATIPWEAVRGEFPQPR